MYTTSDVEVGISTGPPANGWWFKFLAGEYDL